MNHSRLSTSSRFFGECLGTFLLVFFGIGSVAAAVALQAQVGLFQVAVVWGLGVSIAILVSGAASGAHLNPAITLSFAVNRGFPWKMVPLYIAAQFTGAFLAACAVFAIFGGAIALFEEASQITRGAPGSEASAMIFGEFYPNPGGSPISEAARSQIGAVHALLAEFFGTALLALAVFALTDPKNEATQPRYAPFAIGATLCCLISLLAPISMAGFNPARDLAPRIFSSLAGWGELPFALNGHGWLSVYIVAPMAGGITGGWLYGQLVGKRLG